MSQSDESRRVTGKSVAAFMLLPQFHMCFKGFSHLWPVFMRCLALVFLESRLISPDHPANRYGEPGVEKVSILELFGTAWFTLRVTRADTYQWGMFIGILLMIGMMLTTVGIFFMRIFFGIGTAAAQYYLPNVFDQPCDSYNGGACPVGGAFDASINGAVANITAPPAGTLFDMRVQGSNGPDGTKISTDYALMVLDKILRQSMTAPSPGQNGGITQNALADLMGIYNTGMTLIAGIVTLWMVMAMVVQTAKSGRLGAGRTNMVWVPIRMVFALGIIMPLGAQGYSSGQYIVMKLAEWGSNLGTRGWVAYIQGVAGASMLAPFSVSNVTSLAAGINKIMACQVAYNTALLHQTGDLDVRQVVRVKQDDSSASDAVVNNYTNDTEPNLCGTITYTRNKGGTVDTNAFITSTAVTTPMDPTAAAAAANAANRRLNTNYNAALANAVVSFRGAMMAALEPLLTENMDDPSAPAGQFYGYGVNSGPVITRARQLACQIVARHYEQEEVGGGGPNPVSQLGTVAGGVYNSCPGVPASPVPVPDTAIPQEQVNTIMDAILCQYDGTPSMLATSPPCGNAPGTGARQFLMGYITAPGGLVAELEMRGWAGMGRFYLDLASLNSQIQALREPMATYNPGSIWDGAGKGGVLAGIKCAGRKLMNVPCHKPKIEEVTVQSLGEYDAWWAGASMPAKLGGATANNDTNVQNRNQGLRQSAAGESQSLTSLCLGLITGSTSGTDIMRYVIGLILPRGADGMFTQYSTDLAASGTYPLAQLTASGHSIMNFGLILLAGLTIIQVIWGGELFSLTGGPGLAVSMISNVLRTVSMSMIMAGMMIAFYLPVVPLLRVAMAVLTWMFSIFEAIVMVPVAALAHLSMQQEGLTGHGARTIWILWLNVLMRPILVVIGFVGSMLLFNAFANYFHTTYMANVPAMLTASIDPLTYLFGTVCYIVIYFGTMYTAANMCFKLLDLLPNGLMRWLGGSPDHKFGDASDNMLAATRFAQGLMPDLSRPKGKEGADTKPGLDKQPPSPAGASGGGGGAPKKAAT